MCADTRPGGLPSPLDIRTRPGRIQPFRFLEVPVVADLEHRHLGPNVHQAFILIVDVHNELDPTTEPWTQAERSLQFVLQCVTLAEVAHWLRDD